MNESILVSSSENLFLVDIVTQEIKPFVKTHPEMPIGLSEFIMSNSEMVGYGKGIDYYGITWIGDKIYATVGEFPSVLSVFDREGNLLKTYMPPRQHPQIIRAHQITAANNDIIITSTNNDLLFRFDTVKEQWGVYHIGTSGFIPIFNKEIFHPNSIRFIDNQLHVIILTSLKTSALVKFDYPSMRMIEKVPVNFLSHCSWEMHGEIWSCSSTNNCIESLSGKKIQLDGWTRGVALSDKNLIIGSGQFGRREDRKKTNSTIWVFDAKTLKKNYEIPFQGSIRDIRLFNVIDKVHNQPIFYENKTH
jgi:hypothetical protein